MARSRAPSPPAWRPAPSSRMSLGQGRGARGRAPAFAGRRSLRPRPSDRRHRGYRSEAGFDTLFEGRWFLITPPPGTDEAAIERVAELWRRAGSMIARMDAAHHDHVLAITSHIPQSDRLHHRRDGDRSGGPSQVRGDQVFRRGVSRFHPDRGLRPGDVAATSSSTTATPCSRCSAASPRTCPRFSARSASATEPPSKCCSRAPATSGAAWSRRSSTSPPGPTARG